MISLTEIEHPVNFVVFGATGDLSTKKLFPSLYRLFLEKALPKSFQMICVVRSTLSHEHFVKLIEKNCTSKEKNPEHFKTFAQLISITVLNINQTNSFKTLSTQLATHMLNILYFAVPPTLYGQLTSGLAKTGCLSNSTRVVVEKPIGNNLETATQINKKLTQYFNETQIFRIDHYLGKETVQNIMALRFGNAILEPLWCAERIQYIQITVAEDIGVESRGPYYDSTGALRDMVQNHLLQLLCIVTMEPPAQINAYAVRDEKLKVLHALRPIQPNDVVTKTARGHYIQDSYQMNQMSYINETGVDPLSQTETFVAIKTEIDNWRWAGMPIYLRTGKRLRNRHSEIIIQFKEVPHKLFGHTSSHLLANRLSINLQPEENIKLFLNAKTPGKGMNLEPMALNLDLTSHSKSRRWEAYERLIIDIIQGDLTLFMREKDVLSAWQWIDPIILGWQQYMPQPEPYIIGSWGPVAADQLLARDGYIWHNPL